MHVELELTRANEADDPFAVRIDAEETYLLPEPDGTVTTATLAWQEASLRSDLEAIHEPDCPAEVAQRMGERLRRLLRGTSWSRKEQEILRAAAQGQSVTITMRSNAAELYALPWELMTLRATGQHLCELPRVMIRYAWPGTHTVPASDRNTGTPGRILMAWSDAGGFVPADEHQAALAAACPPAHFDPEQDVLPRVSWSRLDRVLARARNDGRPVTALHILCHGSRRGDATCLAWNHGTNDDDERQHDVDGVRLRKLLAPYADQVRLVVLCACESGRHGQLDNHLGSVALNLHRAGIETVVASRAPLSIPGSIAFTRAFYGALVTEGQAIESAFPHARRHLAGMRTGDWTSLICYGRPTHTDDGETRVFQVTPSARAPTRPDAAPSLIEQSLVAGQGEHVAMAADTLADPPGDGSHLPRRTLAIAGAVAAALVALLAVVSGTFDHDEAPPSGSAAKNTAHSTQNTPSLGDAQPRTEHSVIRIVRLVEPSDADTAWHLAAHPGTQLCEALQRHGQTLRAAYDVRPGEVLCGAASSLSAQHAQAERALTQAAVQAQEEGVSLIVLVHHDGRARMAALGTLHAWLGPDMPSVSVATEAARDTVVPVLWALAQVARGNTQAAEAGCPETPRSTSLDAMGVLALFLAQRIDGCALPAQPTPTGRALLEVCEQTTISWACPLARILYAELYPQEPDAQAQLGVLLEDDEYQTFAAVALPSLVLAECEQGRLLLAYQTLHRWFDEGRDADPRLACQRLSLSEAVTCMRVHERADTAFAALPNAQDELEQIAHLLGRDCELCPDREACTSAFGLRGWRLGRAGRWAQARDDLEEAFRRSRRADHGLPLVEANLHLGDVDGARRLLDALGRDRTLETAADHLHHALYAWLAARQRAASGDSSAALEQAHHASMLVAVYEHCCAEDGCRLDAADAPMRTLVCASSEPSACVFELLSLPWSRSYLPELQRRLGVPESSSPPPPCADAAAPSAR